jgi:hypothetical protein
MLASELLFLVGVTCEVTAIGLGVRAQIVGFAMIVYGAAVLWRGYL